MDATLRTRHSSVLPQVSLRHITYAATSLSFLLVKIIGVALAMLFVPRALHIGVQCFDELYETLGRRAQSPWGTRVLGGYGVAAGGLLMIALHVALWRVCYSVILNEGEEHHVKTGKEDSKRRAARGVSWERALVRIIIPAFMFGGLLLMMWKLRVLSGQEGRPYVKANTVDIADGTGAQLIWWDR